jgi:ribokinase
MPKIVVIGSFNMDLITYVQRIPQLGETVTDGQFQTAHGGKGSNQAVGAARLAADVSFIACIGDDGFGNDALALWQAEGIDAQVQIVQTPTGIASILVDEKGENIIAVAPGANRQLTIAHVDALESRIAEADVLMAQLEIPLEVVEHVFTLAKRHNTKILLNPAPVRKGLEPLIALADIITPNETEAEQLGKLPSEKMIVTTLGGDGAAWRTGGKEGRVPAYKVEVVDTVGGGDAFNAGLAVAIAEGKDLAAAVQFANAVAALSVTKKGAAASMPKREEVEAFINQNH